MDYLVSVCIPTYNGSSYLKEALESITYQTYKNLEVIISDDYSKDNTKQIAEEFKNKSEFLVTIVNHKPAGIGANWNNCVKLAKGEFIKFLFQDDVLAPTCIEKMMKLAVKDKRLGMVYCKRAFIYDEENNVHKNWVSTYKSLHTHWDKLKIETGILKGKIYLKDKNIFAFPENKIGEPTAVIIRKECFEQVGYFRTDLQQALDLEFWSRILKYYQIGFIDEFLIWFRLHEDQATSKNKKKPLNEAPILEEIYYKNFLWVVHPLVAWQLFKKRKL